MLPKKSKNIISVVLLSQIFFANHSIAKESEAWSYVGRTGPDQWSKLDDAFALCREGVTQSPINLDTKKLADNKDPLIFHYESYKITSEDFSIKSVAKSKRLEISGKTYKLAQFHFHAPGEHSIDSKISPVELHFVHQDKDGNLAVVGVMINEGKSNPILKSIIDTANKDSQAKYDIEDGDLMKLLPENKEYFHYMGSLTTPPCTEGVHWYVLKTPIEASKEELAALDKAMPDNARPIQDNNGRVAN